MIYKLINHDFYLKQLEKSDSHELFSLVDNNRKYLREWLPWIDDTESVNDSEDFIILSNERYNGNKAFDLGIWYKNNLAGIIGIHEINWQKEETAIGYWIAEKYQGLGLITNSVKFIVQYSFNEIGLKKIYIRCATQNIKSRNIPEKLGFSFVEIVELSENLYGHLVDHALYSIDYNDYLLKIDKFNL